MVSTIEEVLDGVKIMEHTGFVHGAFHDLRSHGRGQEILISGITHGSAPARIGIVTLKLYGIQNVGNLSQYLMECGIFKSI